MSEPIIPAYIKPSSEWTAQDVRDLLRRSREATAEAFRNLGGMSEAEIEAELSASERRVADRIRDLDIQYGYESRPSWMK